MNRILWASFLIGFSYSVQAVDLPDVEERENRDITVCIEGAVADCTSNTCSNSQDLSCMQNCQEMAEVKCKRSPDE